VSVEGAIAVRDERPGDAEGIRSVLIAAFPTSAEADLVDALREGAERYVSLVADGGDRIVGHILFTEMTLEPARGGLAFGLAPLAVSPESQHHGVGADLVETGLERCRKMGATLVIVLGEPDYYARFGFEPASRLRLRSTWDVPEEAFMALALGAVGESPEAVARYRPEFDAFA